MAGAACGGRWILALLALPWLAVACATPVGTRPMGTEAIHRTLTRSVLSTGEPSVDSAQVLQRLGLGARFEAEPAAALAVLHATLGPTGNEDRLFALAELSFLHAERTRSRAHHLASAVYAYAFLFPEGAGREPDALDPRRRLAADLYNRGLTEGLTVIRADEDVEEVVLAAGRHALPFGELEVALEPDSLIWTGRRLERFRSAAKLEVRGLRNRYRQAGIGAPLVASLGTPPTPARPAAIRLPPRLSVPVTAVLRLDGARRGLPAGRLQGRLEVYPRDAAATVALGGREVPLEVEPSAALAHLLEDSPIWETELRGFLRGDYVSGAGAGLYTLTPYRPGRVPVVLVHGTASSPARWAELINELDSDPRIGAGYQFWFFVYNTGNPILYSGGLLRAAIEQAMADFDPEGRDAALRRMVVIGHSQGGLLTKLTAVDSGTRFWDNVAEQPLETLDVSEGTRTILRRSVFHTPLPFVRRVIFVATPHRGSDIAGFVARNLGRLVQRSLTLPTDVVQGTAEVLTRSEDPLLRRALAQGMVRSVDNMSPTQRFVRTLAEIPVAPGISAHSIIAVRGDGPPEDGSDGVVSYRSAHLDEAVSEKVVRSGHSTQSHPDTIEEVRRILLEHLAAP